MYNLSEMRPFNTAFWHVLAAALAEAGVSDLPADLLFERAAVPACIGPEVLFTQTCGYPLQTIYSRQYAMLGVPRYDAPGCDAPEIQGPSHRAFFLVRSDDPVQDLNGLRGRVFACNSPHSNSGMNLPRRTLAPLAGGRPFFSRVVWTGTHPASMQRVQSGEADAAAIDNLTYAFHADYRPAALVGLRVLAETVPSPAIPFVTAATTEPSVQMALNHALAHFSQEGQFADLRDRLRIREIVPPDGVDYGLLSRYIAEAEALGYPLLA